MTEYLTDLSVNEDRDIYLDGSNDLATTSGVDNLHQSIALSTLDITENFISTGVSAEDLAYLETRVEQYLANDPQVGTVLSVRTESVNRQSGEINMRVYLTENTDFEVTVNAD